MTKKRCWMIIPAVLLPYLGLFTLATIFFSSKLPFFAFIVEFAFHNNGLNLIAALLLCCALATVLSIICFAASIRKRWDALSLAKCAMIVKLIQVPAYILIFASGVFLLITIFTIPFSIGLFLLDCLCLFLSGLLVASASINAVRQGLCEPKEIIWVIILQFVFCADVISSIVFYRKLKRTFSCETQS